jgi:beta-glucosidase
VSVTVKNVGRRRGSDVAQLYVAIPGPGASVVAPPRQLKGFRKVRLRPGRSTRISFALENRSFAYWDTGRHAWLAPSGCYSVFVGRSSRDLPLHGTVPWRRHPCK